MVPMTDPELRKLRRRLDSIRRGRGRRIRVELPARVAVWVAKRREHDNGWSELARKLGVSGLTLQRWSSGPVRRAVMRGAVPPKYNASSSRVPQIRPP